MEGKSNFRFFPDHTVNITNMQDLKVQLVDTIFLTFWFENKF